MIHGRRVLGRVLQLLGILLVNGWLANKGGRSSASRVYVHLTRKTHAVHMTKSGRHADKGRNACVAAQRVFVTPVRRNTAKN